MAVVPPLKLPLKLDIFCASCVSSWSDHSVWSLSIYYEQVTFIVDGIHMSPLTEDFRSPFATSALLGIAISTIAFLVSLVLVFIDINDEPVPEWIYQAANRESFTRLRQNLPIDPNPPVAIVHHYGNEPDSGSYYSQVQE